MDSSFIQHEPPFKAMSVVSHPAARPRRLKLATAATDINSKSDNKNNITQTQQDGPGRKPVRLRRKPSSKSTVSTTPAMMPKTPTIIQRKFPGPGRRRKEPLTGFRHPPPAFAREYHLLCVANPDTPDFIPINPDIAFAELRPAQSAPPHPFFGLRPDIRKCIYYYCFPEELRKISLSPSFATNAVFEKGWLASPWEILEHVSGGLAANRAFREDLMTYFWTNYEFHVTLSPFSAPILSPLSQVWLPNYLDIIQRLTLELDCTRFGASALVKAPEIGCGTGILERLFNDLISGLGKRKRGLHMAELKLLCRRFEGLRPWHDHCQDRYTQTPFCPDAATLVCGDLVKLGEIPERLQIAGFLERYTHTIVEGLLARRKTPFECTFMNEDAWCPQTRCLTPINTVKRGVLAESQETQSIAPPPNTMEDRHMPVEEPPSKEETVAVEEKVFVEESSMISKSPVLSKSSSAMTDLYGLSPSTLHHSPSFTEEVETAIGKMKISSDITPDTTFQTKKNIEEDEDFIEKYYTISSVVETAASETYHHAADDPPIGLSLGAQIHQYSSSSISETSKPLISSSYSLKVDGPSTPRYSPLEEKATSIAIELERCPWSFNSLSSNDKSRNTNSDMRHPFLTTSQLSPLPLMTRSGPSMTSLVAAESANWGLGTSPKSQHLSPKSPNTPTPNSPASPQTPSPNSHISPVHSPKPSPKTVVNMETLELLNQMNEQDPAYVGGISMMRGGTAGGWSRDGNVGTPTGMGMGVGNVERVGERLGSSSGDEGGSGRQREGAGVKRKFWTLTARWKI